MGMRKNLIFCFIFSCFALFAETYDVVVVGGGPAGLTSGLYASRLGLKTLVAEGQTPGGQLITTHIVENFPGFVDGIDGPLLISNMRSQALKYGTHFKTHEVVDIDFNSVPYKLTLSNREVIEAKSGHSRNRILSKTFRSSFRAGFNGFWCQHLCCL